MLRTRAPLSCSIAKTISFDLHVLGLPLAFILSQDQTLHCKKFVSDFFSKYYVWGPLFLLFKLQRTFLFLKGTAKVRLFFTFPKFIFIYFFNAYSTHFVDIFIYILQCRQPEQSLYFLSTSAYRLFTLSLKFVSNSLQCFSERECKGNIISHYP